MRAKILIGLYILIGFIIGLIVTKPAKQEYNCPDVAQEYLMNAENMWKKEPGNWGEKYGPKQRAMAIDVETDIYKLCTIGLDEESLKSFKSTVIERYQK
jgi:hypothetical protein